MAFSITKAKQSQEERFERQFQVISLLRTHAIIVLGRIVRTGHDIHLAKENVSLEPSALRLKYFFQSSQDDNGRMPTSNNISSEKELAQLVYKDGHFWIQECKSKPKESPEPENSKSGDDGIWVVVKSLKTANANRIVDK